MKLPRVIAVLLFALFIGAGSAVVSITANPNVAYAKKGGDGGSPTPTTENCPPNCYTPTTINQGGITVAKACDWLDNDDKVSQCYGSYGANKIFTGENGSDDDPAHQIIQKSDQAGRFQTSNYDIGYEEGGTLSFSRKIEGAIMNIVFGWVTGLVNLGMWFLEWAFRFELVHTLASWAGKLNTMYNASFINYSHAAGTLNLHAIFFYITCIYGAFHIVRGRFGKGMGEILVSGIIFMVLLVVTASPNWPGGYMEGGFHLVGGLAGELMQMAQNQGEIPKGTGSPNRDAFYGKDFYGMDLSSEDAWHKFLASKCQATNFAPVSSASSTAVDQEFDNYQANYSQIICPTVSTIHKAFVDEPQRYATWGTLASDPTGSPGKNLKYRQFMDNVLLTGNWGTDDEPRTGIHGDTGGDAGLDQSFYNTGTQLIQNGDDYGQTLDDFNNHPSFTRLLIVFMTFIAALIAMASIILLCVSVGIAEFVAAVLFAFAPFALAAGLLPGAGRSAMIKWMAALLKALIVVLVLANFLVLLTAGVSFVMENTEGQSLIARFSILILIVFMMFIARKKLHEGTGRAMASFGNQMTQLRVKDSKGGGGGGGQQWPSRPMAEHHVGGLNNFRQTQSGQMVTRNIQSANQGRKSQKRMDKSATKRQRQMASGKVDEYGKSHGILHPVTARRTRKANILAQENAGRVRIGAPVRTGGTANPAKLNPFGRRERKARAERAAHQYIDAQASGSPHRAPRHRRMPWNR